MNAPTLLLITAALGISLITLRHLWRESIRVAEIEAGKRGFLHGRQSAHEELTELDT